MRPKARLNASLTKYAVVYDGETWMELDDGEMLHLKRGDVVIVRAYNQSRSLGGLNSFPLMMDLSWPLGMLPPTAHRRRF